MFNSFLKRISAFSLLLGLASGSQAATAPQMVLVRIEGEMVNVIGGVQQGHFLTVQQIKPLPNPSVFGLYQFKKLGTWNTSGKISESGCLDNLRLTDVPPKPWNQEGSDLYGYSANFNPLPRMATALDPKNPTYTKIALQYLQSQGLKAKSATLSQIYRVDLNNDKQDEVVMVLNGVADPALPDNSKQGSANVGDYSAVLVRQMVKGKVTTQVLGKSLQTKPAPADELLYHTRYQLGGFLDLDNDDNLEILLNDVVWEGYGTRVYRWDNTVWKTVIDWGCGS